MRRVISCVYLSCTEVVYLVGFFVVMRSGGHALTKVSSVWYFQVVQENVVSSATLVSSHIANNDVVQGF